MAKQKQFYRRQRAKEAEEAKKGFLQAQRNKFLLIPPLLGAAAGYLQNEHMKSKATGIEEAIANQRTEFLSSYSRMVSSIKQDSELLVQAREAGKDGRYDLQDLIRLGEQVEARHPGYTAQLQDISLRYIIRNGQLRSELRQAEAERPSSVAKAFAAGTAASYALIAFVYAYVSVQRKLASMRVRARMEEAAVQKKESRTRSQPPPEERTETRRLATPSNSPAERAPQKGPRRTPPETPVVDLGTLIERKKNGEGKKAEQKQASIFADETAEELKSRLIDPKELEKAMIRAFKILSRNSIFVGMRYAQTPDVKRDFQYSAGEAAGVKLLAFLESVDLLEYHKGCDCVSLNPHPTHDLGKLLIRDVTANLMRMGKKTG